jgi:hypothetical protein
LRLFCRVVTEYSEDALLWIEVNVGTSCGWREGDGLDLDVLPAQRVNSFGQDVIPGNTKAFGEVLETSFKLN